jgi:hypothetical protein
MGVYHSRGSIPDDRAKNDSRLLAEMTARVMLGVRFPNGSFREG